MYQLVCFSHVVHRHIYNSFTNFILFSQIVSEWYDFWRKKNFQIIKNDFKCDIAHWKINAAMLSIQKLLPVVEKNRAIFYKIIYSEPFGIKKISRFLSLRWHRETSKDAFLNTYIFHFWRFYELVSKIQWSMISRLLLFPYRSNLVHIWLLVLHHWQMIS